MKSGHAEIELVRGNRVSIVFQGLMGWLHAFVEHPWEREDQATERLITDRGTVRRKDGVMWWHDRDGPGEPCPTVTSVELITLVMANPHLVDGAA